jgi:hypothetical protein
MNTISNDVIKMSLFSKIKTGNIIFDTMITTFILTVMSYIVKIVYEMTASESDNNFTIFDTNILEKIRYVFYKKNSIIMNGKKCSAVNWQSSLTVNSVFGDRFKAVWEEIINNIEDNPTIYEIKDYLTLTESTNSIKNGENNKTNKSDDVFIVSQKRAFLFNKELKIYAQTIISSEETKNEKEKGSSKIDNIEIILYSYELRLSQIKNHIDILTKKYLEDIERSRNNKQFIYTLIKTKYEDCKFECWKESIFDTTRCFENMFFEQKKMVVEKIDFFLNNKDWYYRKGIPYTIGFGLHGPPGTGKTSFIKSLAKYTNRHIIVLSLKLIKTRRQLQDFFYEDRYNDNNKKRSLGFDKKIIVIEDIDAQGDIVLDRSRKNSERKNSINLSKITEKTNVGEVIKTLMENDAENEKKLISTVMRPNDDEPITLDDILNLWDGIEETSGRMLVISSNHYEDLDPALTRPGRIDISIAMNNASREIIAELYFHLYEKSINTSALNKVKPYFYSPADIINFYIIHKNDEQAFIKRLVLNKK